MKRLMVIALLLAVSAVPGTGSAGLFKKGEFVFKKGRRTWVKLEKGNKKLLPFEHPLQVSPEQMKALLLSLRYFKPGFLSVSGKQGKELDLFTPEEAEVLARPLAEALAKAGPETWVDFSIEVFRGQGFIGTHYLTDGVVFAKDGSLNLAFRNIAVKVAPDSEVNEFDPTRGYRAFNRLVSSGPLTAKKDNWVQVPLEKLSSLKQKEAPTGKPEAAERKTPEPAAEPSAAPSSPKPGSAPPGQSPAANEKSIKERLLELQELYDEGLITKEEYEKKRKQILDEL